MGFLCIVIGIAELLCCILMPTFASLHLISEKYREKNNANTSLFKHWCFYWIAYFALRMCCGFFSFLPSGITGILCFVRVALLSVMALPRFNLPVLCMEFLQERIKNIGSMKDFIVSFIVGMISGEKKKA
jgi:hypothetical protein